MSKKGLKKPVMVKKCVIIEIYIADLTPCVVTLIPKAQKYVSLEVRKIYRLVYIHTYKGVRAIFVI